MILAACSEKSVNTVGLINASADVEKNAVDSTKLIADQVYNNGKIITVNDAQPKAQVVAVHNGKIIYVGDLRGATPMIDDRPSIPSIRLKAFTINKMSNKLNPKATK